MDVTFVMDKKVLTRASQPPSKGGQDPSVKDYPSKKNGQTSSSRKRENDRVDNVRRSVAGRGGRSGQRYVRPREKAGCQVEQDDAVSEAGSIFRHGSKKQNITHLMDWWGPANGDGGNKHTQRHWVNKTVRGAANNRRNSSHYHKYSKEHYLQANCQFVVMDGKSYTTYQNNPDLLVDWKLVEEVRLHMSVAPSCPICLHPPIAAKVTRCGHIYCYPCILHYLALSDKKWRKCPICYDVVDKDEIKSAIWIVHKDYQLGEEITLQLMRRERDSLVAVSVEEYNPELMADIGKLGNSSPDTATPYTKLLVATCEEVRDRIIGREERELAQQLVDEGDQPEAIFIDQALDLLKQRLAESSIADGLSKQLLNLNISTKVSSSVCTNSDKVVNVKDYSFPLKNEVLEYPTNDLPNKNVKLTENKDNVASTAITAEDLDISQLQPSPLTQHDQAQKNQPKTTFYFYQAMNGAQIYLHALNVQMLVCEYGSLDQCPRVIKGKILEKESTSMTEDLRDRLRYLRHMPVTCVFEVVEIALEQTIVSPLTMTEFKDQINSRRKNRNIKAREERRIEKRVQAKEDHLMGRRPNVNVHMSSLRHFPAFADDVPQSLEEVSIYEQLDETTSSNDSTVTCSSPDNDVVSQSSSVPSFAQMIRDGQVVPSKNKVGVAWPSLGSDSTAWNSDQRRSRKTTECSEDLEEDCAPAVPEFKNTFSDDFAMAFDRAAKIAKANNEPNGKLNSKGKNKKRKKGIVLLSSGGI